jgi:ABC-type transporter Mla subunit MlaD
MIENSVTKTALGVQISEKVAKSLQEIVDKVRQVDTLAAEVASGSKEQSSGIEQINIAVTQLDKVTQSNAANAEESASASEELSAQAQTLKDAVAELLALVGGAKAGQNNSQRTGQESVKPHAEIAPALNPNGAHNGRGNAGGRTMKHLQAALSSTKTRSGSEVAAVGEFRDF